MKSNTKNKSLLDVLTINPVFDDGIVFSDPGISAHKSAKRQTTFGVYDSLFEAFERTWGALHSFQALSDPKNDIILEMGCAEMPIYNAFKMMRMFPNYIGVDIRRDYLGSSAHRNRKDVLALCADLTKPLPLKDGSVSAIILSEVVEHLSYDDNILIFKDAFRLLKPGGKVLVSSPINTTSREFHDVKKETHLGHVFFWTAEEFESEMKNLGFSKVDKKWGYSVSSKIKVNEIKKSLPVDVRKFLEDISHMYGSRVARALALSAPGVVNGGCRFTVTK
jgi:SAM-dependent methyltransferase